MVTATATEEVTVGVAGSIARHGPIAAATVSEQAGIQMEMETVAHNKVLRWARVFQPLIPLDDDLRFNASPLSGWRWGDGHAHGNGSGNGHGDGLDNSPWTNGDGIGYGEWAYENGDGYCDMY